MKYAGKITLAWVTLLSLSFMTIATGAFSEADIEREYKIKAAFLYNLLQFTDWPQTNESPKAQDIITIGIVGESPFGNSDFDTVKDKNIPGKNRKLVIRSIVQPLKETDLSNCHVIFVCASEQKHINSILESVKNSPVLTIADSDDFVKAGGMVELVIHRNKIRWRLNSTAIQTSGLRLNSQVYRNAVDIVGDK